MLREKPQGRITQGGHTDSGQGYGTVHPGPEVQVGGSLGTGPNCLCGQSSDTHPHPTDRAISTWIHTATNRTEPIPGKCKAIRDSGQRTTLQLPESDHLKMSMKTKNL